MGVERLARSRGRYLDVAYIVGVVNHDIGQEAFRVIVMSNAKNVPHLVRHCILKEIELVPYLSPIVILCRCHVRLLLREVGSTLVEHPVHPWVKSDHGGMDVLSALLLLPWTGSPCLPNASFPRAIPRRITHCCAILAQRKLTPVATFDHHLRVYTRVGCLITFELGVREIERIVTERPELEAALNCTFQLVAKRGGVAQLVQNARAEHRVKADFNTIAQTDRR